MQIVKAPYATPRNFVDDDENFTLLLQAFGDEIAERVWDSYVEAGLGGSGENDCVYAAVAYAEENNLLYCESTTGSLFFKQAYRLLQNIKYVVVVDNEHEATNKFLVRVFAQALKIDCY